jgi:hypothetical protein
MNRNDEAKEIKVEKREKASKRRIRKPWKNLLNNF